jgi:hypothetical protein
MLYTYIYLLFILLLTINYGIENYIDGLTRFWLNKWTYDD